MAAPTAYPRVSVSSRGSSSGRPSRAATRRSHRANATRKAGPRRKGHDSRRTPPDSAGTRGSISARTPHPRSSTPPRSACSLPPVERSPPPLPSLLVTAPRRPAHPSIDRTPARARRNSHRFVRPIPGMSAEPFQTDQELSYSDGLLSTNRQLSFTRPRSEDQTEGRPRTRLMTAPTPPGDRP